MGLSLHRRALLHGLAATAGAGAGGVTSPAIAAAKVVTGAQALVAADFAALAGKRIGLVANHTARVGEAHLADLMAQSKRLRLAAILAPEHGFRGGVEAGAKVKDGRDPRTGVPVLSLYGATRKPSPAMLAGLDALVFDIQDVGVRFYTYISTMGLAMQAAAAARLPFFVLDRPNPIGGEDVSGFVLEPALRSFVGQYPIPIVHGMSVGELARMIKGERWLSGLDALDLQIVPTRGWTRSMRWPATGLPWVATSPNIPTFEAALVYPGIGIVGETLVNEGRGTPIPFSQFGAPWLDAAALASRLNAAKLSGVRFIPTSYTPRSIANVAANPRFEGQPVVAVRLEITDVDRYRPLEVGIHALALLRDAARAAGRPLLDKRDMFDKIAGTRRLHAMLFDEPAPAAAIIGSWRAEVDRFRSRRTSYLLH